MIIYVASLDKLIYPSASADNMLTADPTLLSSNSSQTCDLPLTLACNYPRASDCDKMSLVPSLTANNLHQTSVDNRIVVSDSVDLLSSELSSCFNSPVDLDEPSKYVHEFGNN